MMSVNGMDRLLPPARIVWKDHPQHPEKHPMDTNTLALASSAGHALACSSYLVRLIYRSTEAVDHVPVAQITTERCVLVVLASGMALAREEGETICRLEAA